MVGDVGSWHSCETSEEAHRRAREGDDRDIEVVLLVVHLRIIALRLGVPRANQRQLIERIQPEARHRRVRRRHCYHISSPLALKTEDAPNKSISTSSSIPRPVKHRSTRQVGTSKGLNATISAGSSTSNPKNVLAKRDQSKRPREDRPSAVCAAASRRSIAVLGVHMNGIAAGVR